MRVTDRGAPRKLAGGEALGRSSARAARWMRAGGCCSTRGDLPAGRFNANGKIQVESKKQMKARGVQSPNLFDALVIPFSENMREQKKAPPIFINHRTRDRAIGY